METAFTRIVLSLREHYFFISSFLLCRSSVGEMISLGKEALCTHKSLIVT
jgi:hypothetical protein